MAEPLPSGWTDTGVTGTSTVTGSAILRFRAGHGTSPEVVFAEPILDWKLFAVGSAPPVPT